MDGTWVVIANPTAGGGRAARALHRLEADGGLELVVHRTACPGDGARLARELELGGCTGLIAVGGDGTLHEVTQGLLARPEPARVPLAVIPAGTGDALARDLGISDQERALAALRAGHTRRVDLAQVIIDGATFYCFSVVGWGAFARINRRAERLRWARGRRYDLAAAAELLRPGRLKGGGATYEGQEQDLILGVACLTEHTGRGMRLAPGASLDDGAAALVEFRRGGRAALARCFAGLFHGTHLSSPLVEMRRVTSLDLDLEPGSWVVLDGEAVPARRLQLRMLPRTLEVFAPPAGTR